MIVLHSVPIIRVSIERSRRFVGCAYAVMPAPCEPRVRASRQRDSLLLSAKATMTGASQSGDNHLRALRGPTCVCPASSDQSDSLDPSTAPEWLSNEPLLSIHLELETAWRASMRVLHSRVHRKTRPISRYICVAFQQWKIPQPSSATETVRRSSGLGLQDGHR